MMIKTFNVTVDILAALAVGLLAIVIAVVALHALIIGGMTAYYLIYS